MSTPVNTARPGGRIEFSGMDTGTGGAFDRMAVLVINAGQRLTTALQQAMPRVIVVLRDAHAELTVNTEELNRALVQFNDTLQVFDRVVPLVKLTREVRRSLIQHPWKEPRSWPHVARQVKPRQSRNGFTQAARLPCYRGTRPR